MSLQESQESAEARLGRGIERLISDRVSGSSLICERACRLLSAYVCRGRDSGALLVLRRAVGSLCRAHPTMALLRALSDNVSESLRATGRRPARQRLRAVADDLARLRVSLSRGREEVARVAAEAIPEGRAILLLSYSGSVAAACRIMCRRRPVAAVVCESRPRREGLLMARVLAGLGCRVTVIADAAMATWVGRAGAIMLGCDWADRQGFINKTGSLALSVLAESAGKPVFVLADALRLRNEVFSSSRMPRHDPGELVPARLPGVSADNRYFERVAWRSVHLLATERGIRRPSGRRLRL